MSTEPKPGLTIDVFAIKATSVSAYEADLRVISQKAAKQDLIVYFGRDEFSDNSKYLYLHAVQRPGGMRHVWCSFNKALVRELRSRGLEAFDLAENPNRTLQLLARARVAVFTVNPAESLRSRLYLAAIAGAIKVQLWHGIGVKRMEMQNLEHKNLLDLASVARMRWSTEIDCIVSPSTAFDGHWRETFGVDRVIRAGYPRNEVLMRTATELERLNAPTGLVKDTPKKKILIVPTWGTAGERHWQRYVPAVAAAAQRLGVEFYLKPHPYEAAALAKSPVPAVNGVTVLPAATDIYPLLNRFAAMVTDHSSIAFDAFHLDMDFLLLPPNDARFYMTEMLEPPVGVEITSLEQVAALPQLLEKAHAYAGNRQAAARRYFETPLLGATETIHDTVLQLARAA